MMSASAGLYLVASIIRCSGSLCLAANNSKYMEVYMEEIFKCTYTCMLYYTYVCTFVKTDAKGPKGDLTSVMVHFDTLYIRTRH